jgi:putative PIN family toxin of toxin-antitoxin system
MKPRIIIDTNVLISALRSRNGASFKVVGMIGTEKFELCISVPLIFEYESVAKRDYRAFGLRYSDIDDILDYICSVAEHRKIHFLWRPVLRNPQDDMVLELAVESEADYIVTHNVKDYVGIRAFGIIALSPKEFLRKIGELK